MPPPDPEDDAALIERSRHDPEAFAGLYDRHAAPLHRYAARRLGASAADDIVADTFLDAFRKRHRYDLNVSDARPWLYGIAANLIGKHSRAEVRMLRAYARTGADPVLAEARMDEADGRLASAAVRQVLRNASAAASRVPPKTTPSPGQWIYARLVQYEYPQGTSSNENWITFDGTKTAYYESSGGPVTVHTSPMTPPADITSDPLAAFNAEATPQTAYYALTSLPTAPSQLLAAVAKTAESVGAANLVAGTPVASHPPRNKGQLEFDYLSLLLWNAAGGVGAPPEAEAAAFRAMAAIPGVTVQRGITDAAGNPAIGVSDDGGYDQLLLDPVSYQVTGLRQLSTGVGPMVAPSPQELAGLSKAERQQILRKLKAQTWPRKGAIVLSLAYAKVSEVSGPGVK